ncbi:MAG: NADH-quinone oxidoreductase subunit NuoH [Phycisphaerae bacterium]
MPAESLNLVQRWLGSQTAFSLLFVAVSIGVILTAVAYLIYFERKISAWIQDRYGPNRVGPLGLLQPLADGLKFFLKEDFTPPRVDRWLFYLAPCIAFVVALVGFVVIPFGGWIHWPWAAPGERVAVQGASLDIGVLYVLAIGSTAVYGVVLGGWASNNKYAFYGAMRSAAQMLSYEIPMGMAILVVILTTGALRLEGMVTAQQAGAWNVLLHPVAALFFGITALAETNRAPFDLAEAEQELVGGYHTEYSAMKLALFFLGEYAHLITACAMMTAMFLGGWEPLPFSRLLAGVPGLRVLHWITVDPSWFAALLRLAVFSGKIAFLIFVAMWLRWTLLRLRFDQLMRLAWQALVPIGLVLVAVQGALLYRGTPAHWFSPLAELATLAVAGWLGALGGRTITGRQSSLGAAARDGGAASRTRSMAGAV